MEVVGSYIAVAQAYEETTTSNAAINIT
ncbi:hypothetical protein SIAM614_21497 [Stappia aggregata IAM 12614]|uniref:Uncharacterized protein n=1 Tax=Roseibium aggregatum (strain ATCC 25650 / DSM 13394 / JCM 20685 / NBRC 16684 / NCIMB 2208 / IAM 12614 / B1) TaxID=384765 RepID=A0P334_ROSAI|nr:hypothetical protein SIAM614_21497 [Stappia aggregata IAM 12614] [Roseibium aggregatum IAM 12614]